MDSPADELYPRRPLRLDYLFTNAQPLYFVTFNTHKRAACLARGEVHIAFVDFCLRAQSFHVAVGRYVIMPDHVHLFVVMPEGGTIALNGWVRSLKTVIGKRLISLGVDKPHWQEGFFDHVLRSDESYGQKWDYVRMNPVRASLCRVVEEWPYQGEVVTLWPTPS